tara:strand:+ start:260 stop:841 length:582 start_codon:yes stop_codon:yes gene_type:complete
MTISLNPSTYGSFTMAQPITFNSAQQSTPIGLAIGHTQTPEEQQISHLSGMLINQEAKTEKAEKLLKSIQKEKEKTEESIRTIRAFIKKKEDYRKQSDFSCLAKARGFSTLDSVSKPGVYLLAKEGSIVYVGQSKNPYARVHQHKSKDFSHVRILHCREDRRTYWESVLIKKINPQYNKTLKKFRPGVPLTRA